MINKKIIATVISMSMLGITACGKIESGGETENDSFAVSTSQEKISDHSEDSQVGTESEDESSSADEFTERTAVFDRFDGADEAIISVNFTCRSNKRIGVGVNSGNVLHNGVVGRAGTPFVLGFDEIENGRVTVSIDPEYLNSVPLKNLILLHYNEEENYYEEIFCDVNEEDNTISADITTDGDYVVTDFYQWGKAWGWDVSDYEYVMPEVNPTPEVFESRDYPCKVTVPLTAHGFEHEEHMEFNDFDYKIFYRIAGDVNYTFTDIAYITPFSDKKMSLDEFSDMMEKAVAEDFEWRDGVKSKEKIVSADGTEGIKFISVHKYVYGSDFTYDTDWLVYFPDGEGGFFELSCENADEPAYAADYEEILSEFTVQK